MEGPSETCLSDDEVAQILEGGPRPAHLEAHIDCCEPCFALLAAAARDTAVPDTAVPAHAGGVERVANRYVLRDVVGQGGMGRVLRAYDTVLSREVALKILRSEVFGADNLDAARERMRQEARMMAGVTHPNIVHVYDVGEADGGIFIAMEYVRGTSVAEWVHQQQPKTASIVQAFADAARGLAAAHGCGVVHRDVKPSNLLVDASDHVRVTDFGLALATASTEYPAAQSSGHSGTPGFMAPEQARGAAVTPAVDQYALGLALLGAITRRAPLAPDEVRSALVDPEQPWPAPKLEGVPRSLARVIRRATQIEPTDRFPSIEAMAEALDASQRKRSRLVPAAAILGLSVGAIALLTARPADPCAHTAGDVGVHWNAQVRQRLSAALAHTGQSPVFARTTIGTLEAHAAAWRDIAPRVCAMAQGQDAGRLACLDGKLEALGTYIELLGVPDAAVLERAPGALARWSVTACTHPATSDTHPAALSAKTQRRLARASALVDLGRAGAAETLLDDDPFTPAANAQANVLRGAIAQERNESERAQAYFSDSLLRTIELDDVPTQVGARLGLADVSLRLEGRTARARAELDQAAALLTRHQDADLRREAARLWVEVFMLDNAPGLALEHLDDWFPPTEEPSDALALQASIQRVGLLVAVGRYEDAVWDGQRATQRAIAMLGDVHPMVADARTQLAEALAQAGKLDEALTEALKAVKQRESWAENDTQVRGLANALNILGMVHWRRQALPLARDAFERSMACSDPRDPDYGITLDNLGTVLLHEGKFEDAERVHRQAIDTMNATRGEGHYEVALAYSNLGEALYQQGRYAQAHDAYAEGLRRNERARGLGHPDNAAMLLGIGKTLMKRTQYAEAVAPLRRAVALREAQPEDRYVLGVLRYALAVALEFGPKDMEAATQLVRAAVSDLAAADLPSPDLERARSWLKDHGRE